jgi:hypothetical protein
MHHHSISLTHSDTEPPPRHRKEASGQELRAEGNEKKDVPFPEPRDASGTLGSSVPRLDSTHRVVLSNWKFKNK